MQSQTGPSGPWQAVRVHTVALACVSGGGGDGFLPVLNTTRQCIPQHIDSTRKLLTAVQLLAMLGACPALCKRCVEVYALVMVLVERPCVL